MSDLPKRSLTAILFAAIVLMCTYFSFYSFLLLLIGIVLGSITELQNLFEKAQWRIDRNYLWIKTLLSILLIVYPCFDNQHSLWNTFYFTFILLSVVLFAEFLFRKNFAQSIAEFFILLYVWIFLYSALDVFYFANAQQYNFYYPLTIILIIWTNDTFAYFTGTVFGKHKLMPDVSPKKSVEGLAGGLIFSIIAGFLMYTYFLSDKAHWSVTDSISISLIVSIVGTMGDLIESKLKRIAHVKDSGRILPGHGGILDRFDAWFLSIPAIALYFQIKQWF